jgi:hypothetical protein
MPNDEVLIGTIETSEKDIAGTEAVEVHVDRYVPLVEVSSTTCPISFPGTALEVLYFTINAPVDNGPAKLLRMSPLLSYKSSGLDLYEPQTITFPKLSALIEFATS